MDKPTSATRHEEISSDYDWRWWHNMMAAALILAIVFVITR
jgi:hypothetical protein